MIDHDNILPPPSLADILSGGEDLIGRVDFSSRLVTESRSQTPQVAAKPVVQRPAAKAERTSEPISEPTPEPTPEPTLEPKASPKPRSKPRSQPRTTAKATLRPTLKRVAPPVVEEEPHPEATVEPEPDVEEYDDLDADESESFTEEPDQLDDTYSSSYRDPFAARMTTRHDLPILTSPSIVPDEDVAYLGLSIEDVAQSARTRMQTAELAHLRHLEAIENEAARRLELLTAQAELDAELIRLHARREAHAIITAARTRTGEVSGPSRAERRLADVGSSFSRFADSLESSLAPDHRYQP